ncbi:MAG TPA: ABC transporter substrate-binding protein, partial [Candidatus Eremiobacteraceae bacterium]|nr:ABC transporter substrate-binding protein [Candidatus Eremiobacteraceae bacterium]
MRRLTSHLVAVAATSLLLAACSGQTSSSTGPGSGGQAAGKPHYGGELRIGSGSAHIDTMLPVYAHTEASADDLGFMYDGLTNQDENFKVVPWLATKWEISKDGLTYTFHLRHNATWSDGVPITSADFVFAYKFETNTTSNAPYASDYDVVSSVTAPDKWTVVYALKEPDSPFLSTVAGGLQHAPLPVHVYGNMPASQLQHLDLTKKLVTSGGYAFVEWKPDDHLIMQSNPHWWHGRP